MLNLMQSKDIAHLKLDEIQKKSRVKLSLMENETMPFEYGWVFFYQSEEFVKYGTEDALVGGNAPILVDKYTGSAHLTGTSKDITFYIEEYVRERSTMLP